MGLEVKIPPLGESISSGLLASWHVQDGDAVEEGQLLYELETDKITSEGTAESAGVIHIKAAEGDEVEIGQVVAEIDTDAATPAETSEPKKEKASSSGDTGGNGRSESSDTATQTLSPAARRVAEETGVDPAEVKGTGKGGRVTKADLLAAAEARDVSPDKKEKAEASDEDSKESAAPVPETRPAPEQSERQTRTRLSPLRKRIAERLVQAQHAAAMLTTFNEVDMSAVMRLRKTHQERFVEKHGTKLGFMSFFVKATVHGLQEVPALNAQIDGSGLIQNHYYDIGVAVSTEKGLMVPVVRDCDRLGFAEVEQTIAGYANRAREGKIGIDDLQGGVFTITNGGIFGSMLSTPILNMPQAGILGMHTIKERAVVVDGEIAVRPMMYLALTYDHRIVDGKEAVTFLVKMKEAIENPERLLFGI